MLFSVNYARPTEAGTAFDPLGLFDDEDSDMSADAYAAKHAPKHQKSSPPQDQDGQDSTWWDKQIAGVNAAIYAAQEKNWGDSSTTGGWFDEEITPTKKKTQKKKTQKKTAAAIVTTAPAALPFAYQQLPARPSAFPWFVLALAAGAAYFLWRQQGTK